MQDERQAAFNEIKKVVLRLTPENTRTFVLLSMDSTGCQSAFYHHAHIADLCLAKEVLNEIVSIEMRKF